MPGVHLQAGVETLDTTLPPHMLLQLDSFVPTVLAGLRLAGLDLGTESPSGPKAEAEPGAKRQAIPGTVGDLLAAGLLTAGATVTFKRAGKEAQATVNANGDLVVDGKAYASPSTAAARALVVHPASICPVAGTPSRAAVAVA